MINVAAAMQCWIFQTCGKSNIVAASDISSGWQLTGARMQQEKCQDGYYQSVGYILYRTHCYCTTMAQWWQNNSNIRLPFDASVHDSNET